MKVSGQPNSWSKRSLTDTRSSERFARRISVAYSFQPAALLGQKPTLFRFGSLLNVSEHGLCVRSEEPFSVGRVVALFLKLSDESSGIKALGKVVWAEAEEGGSVRAGLRLIGALPSDWRKFIGDA